MAHQEIKKITDSLIKCAIDIAIPECGEVLVYLLYQNDECVYVGQSMFGLSRAVSHTKTKVFNKIKIIPCSKEEVSDIEALFISEMNPKHNITIPSNKKIVSKDRLKSILKTDGYRINRTIRFLDIKPVGSWGKDYYYTEDFNRPVDLMEDVYDICCG